MQRTARFQRAVHATRLKLRISETTWLFLLAALAGLLAGCGSIAFHYLIRGVQLLAFGPDATKGPLGEVMRAGYPSWRVILAPALGGLIVGPLVHFWSREARGHGVPAVVRAIHERGGRISPVVALVKMIASALTLGSGGSLGREGPVVQIGASIGSGVGQLLGVTPKQLKMLAAGGAAAGLAAIFNAPLGGSFFALEVIVGSFAMEAFGPVVVAAVAATLVSRAVLQPVVLVAPYQLEHTYELLVYVVLGLACGAAAVFFTRGIVVGVAAFERIPVPEWAKASVGGLAVGLMAVEITPRVLGNGYETVDALIGNGSLEVALLVLLAAKLVATCVTLGSGGSGGVFGPSLFLGAVIGSLVGRIALLALPVAPSGAYALVGMAAFVAGATHAPVSMVLMIFEMSGNYTIVLPLLIATSISSVVAKKLFRESVDTVLDARQGRRVHRNVEEMALHGVTVAEAARSSPEAVISEKATVKQVLAQFLAARTQLLAVVDEAGRYKGLLSADWLRERADGDIPVDGIIARDLAATDVPVLDPLDPLTRAVDAFHGAGVEALPVVAREGGRFLGFLSEGDIVSAYRHAVLRDELVSTLAHGRSKRAEPGLDLPDDVVMSEVRAPAWLAGKTLAETGLRTRYGVSVLALHPKGEGSRLPAPDVPIGAEDQLVVFGPSSAVLAMKRGEEPAPIVAPVQAASASA